MSLDLLHRCRSLYEALDAYLDGHMTLRSRFLVRMHLLMCPQCRRYLQQYCLVRKEFAQPLAEQLPEDFEQVMAKVVARWRQS